MVDVSLLTQWGATSQVPIYFSSGMTSKANLYYKLLVNWTNEKVSSRPIFERVI
jgi:Cft2 family RNA processing exonuclease